MNGRHKFTTCLARLALRHPSPECKDCETGLQLQAMTKKALVDRIGIGRRLKQVRQERKLSQAQAGNQAGIPQGIVSSYELGKVDILLKHLITVSRQFDVTLMWLLNGDGPRPETHPDPESEIEGGYLFLKTTPHEELFNRLIKRATIQKRTLKSEILVILEMAVGVRSKAEEIERIRGIINPEEIEQ